MVSNALEAGILVRWLGRGCATRERTMGRGAIAAAETRAVLLKMQPATMGPGRWRAEFTEKRSPKETEGRKG